MRALTVGHSTHRPGDFLTLLAGAGVATLADVRRFPASRRHPHFGRDTLAGALGAAGTAYEARAMPTGQLTPVPPRPQ